MYISFLYQLTVPMCKDTSEAISILGPKFWYLMLFFNKRSQSSYLVDSRMRLKIYTISLEHLIMPESKEVLKYTHSHTDTHTQ